MTPSVRESVDALSGRRPSRLPAVLGLTVAVGGAVLLDRCVFDAPRLPRPVRHGSVGLELVAPLARFRPASHEGGAARPSDGVARGPFPVSGGENAPLDLDPDPGRVGPLGLARACPAPSSGAALHDGAVGAGDRSWSPTAYHVVVTGGSGGLAEVADVAAAWSAPTSPSLPGARLPRLSWAGGPALSVSLNVVPVRQRAALRDPWVPRGGPETTPAPDRAAIFLGAAL